MKSVEKIFENIGSINKFSLKKNKINQILEKKENSINIEVPFEINFLKIKLERRKKKIKIMESYIPQKMAKQELEN